MNIECFEQTLKVLKLSFYHYDSIDYNDDLIEISFNYLDCLFNELEIKRQTGFNADRYYYMLATHAFYAGIDLACFNKQGSSLEKSLEAITSMDSIFIYRMLNLGRTQDELDYYLSDVYELAIGDFQKKFKQKYVIDDSNEYMKGLLSAFFIAGYNFTDFE